MQRIRGLFSNMLALVLLKFVRKDDCGTVVPGINPVVVNYVKNHTYLYINGSYIQRIGSPIR